MVRIALKYTIIDYAISVFFDTLHRNLAKAKMSLIYGSDLTEDMVGMEIHTLTTNAHNYKIGSAISSMSINSTYTSRHNYYVSIVYGRSHYKYYHVLLIKDDDMLCLK